MSKKLTCTTWLESLPDPPVDAANWLDALHDMIFEPAPPAPIFAVRTAIIKDEPHLQMVPLNATVEELPRRDKPQKPSYCKKIWAQFLAQARR